MNQRDTTAYGLRQKAGLLAGIAVSAVVLVVPHPEGLSASGWHTAAVGLLMAVWWISEALPIPATALVPIVLFPVLGILPIGETTAPYANPLIFLFMGGFALALAMERWNLHRRIALTIINMVGTRPSSIIIGFIIASAFLSMWVSNTATALMMLPIAVSVMDLVERNGGKENQRNFQIVLLLSIAYACNIGGMGTIIGTPPNALLVGFLNENYGLEIGFLQWMAAGVPIVLISLPVMYLVLGRIIYPIGLREIPGGRAFIRSQIRQLGPVSGAEMKVAAVFTCTALLWVTRPLLTAWIPGLSDAGIAIAATVILFLVPVDMKQGIFVLSWSELRKLPWGVLILFGGGLSLASAIMETGLAEWIGNGVTGLQGWPIILLLGMIVLIVVFLTEVTSNTATAAAFLPILASVAIGIGQNPLLFVIPAALAASCAFMLPVATPPNAIVFGSGRISMPEMSKAGLWLNVMFIILLTAAAFTLISQVFGIETGVLPGWAY